MHLDVWVTAVTLWYMRLVAVDYRADWTERYSWSYVWLKAQINQDAQVEKEIFESVIERYQVDKEADDSFIKEQENKTKFTEAEN